MNKTPKFLTTETQNGTPARRPWLEYGAPAFLLVLAAVLRMPGLFQEFWGDELCTLLRAMRPLGAPLSERLAGSAATPLVYTLAHATIALFPPFAQFRFPGTMPVTSEVMPMNLSEATLHLPFFLVSLITIAVIFIMARKCFGLNAAFWAGLFLAVSPVHIYYSSEIRFYGLLCLAGVLLIFGVQLVLDGRGWRGWAVTGLGLVLGLLTHLTFFFLTAGVMVGAAVSLLFDAAPVRRRAVMAAGLAGLCVVVVVLQAAVMAHSSPVALGKLSAVFGDGDSADEDPAPKAAGNAATDGTQDPPAKKYRLEPGLYFNTFIAQRYLSCHGVLCGIALAIVLAAGLAGLYARRRSLLFMTLCVLCTPLPFFFMQVGHKWMHRYFIFDILFCAVLAGVGMDVLFRRLRSLAGGTAARPRLGIALCAVLALLVALAYAPSLAAEMKRGADHRSYLDGGIKDASETLARNLAPTDRLLLLRPEQIGGYTYHLVPYYLCRMRPDWYFHGVHNKMTLCGNAAEFRDALAKQPLDDFWIVSFEDNNKEVSLKGAIKDSGAVRCAQYSNTSLWRIGGDQAHRANLLAEEVAAPGTVGIEVPKEGSVENGLAFRVALSDNSDKELKTPTILFPVVRDEDGQPSTGLKEDGGSYTLRFRLQLENITPGSNRNRTFRVMLFAKGETVDLMYAKDSSDAQDYAISVVPRDFRSKSLSGVKIGFGIRGGTGAFRVENVTLQAEGAKR